jgi:HEAT repeat protein
MLMDIYADPASPLQTRIVIAEALGRCGAYAAADTGVRVLATESHRDLLVATLHLLGNVGMERHTAQIRLCCGAQDDVLRINAMQALRKLGGEQDLPLFRQMLEKDSNVWVARHAALALKQFGDLTTLQAIATNLQHPRSALTRQILTQPQ